MSVPPTNYAYRPARLWRVPAVAAIGLLISLTAVAARPGQPCTASAVSASVDPTAAMSRWLIAETAWQRGEHRQSVHSFVQIAHDHGQFDALSLAWQRLHESQQLTRAERSCLLASMAKSWLPWATSHPVAVEYYSETLALLGKEAKLTQWYQTGLQQSTASERADRLKRLNHIAWRFASVRSAQRFVESQTEPYLRLDPEAWMARARFYHDRKWVELTDMALDRALTLKPDFEAAVLLRAESLGENLPAAERLLSHFVGKYPDSPRVRAYLSTLQLSAATRPNTLP